MRVHLINLDRSPERLAEFINLNRHLTDVMRFAAVDGRLVDRAPLIEHGIIESGLAYTDGALGNALSHFALWDRAIEDGEALTLIEDDGITNRGFEGDAEALLRQLPADWHIVYWGWNFDTLAHFELLPGVSSFVANFDQKRLRRGIEAFQSAIVVPRLLRLYAAFGIVSYTISPLGAKVLKQLCLPLGNAPVVIPGVNRTLPNSALDLALVGLLGRVNAFASFPPLVVTRNDHSISTTVLRQSECS
ncbi:MAG: glycosyltransferase family 25 protein [Alphaproteobacteria bacterium]